MMQEHGIGKIARSRQFSTAPGKTLTIPRLQKPSDRRRLDIYPTRKYRSIPSRKYEELIISYNILQRKYL